MDLFTDAKEGDGNEFSEEKCMALQARATGNSDVDGLMAVFFIVPRFGKRP